MKRHIGALLLSVLLGVACSDDDGNAGNNNAACPVGYEALGSACVPIFDDCPGAAERSVLGGGCRAVGVTACATGLFTADGEGGCEPILPPGPEACPAGTMARLGHTDCQPVGVTQCAAGFDSDGAGGCTPVLPASPEPCPAGSVSLLGYTACQPLGDCGTGTWGNIVDDGTTVYVDQSADATGADGSAGAPFTTIGEALAVVVAGGQVAIAAGDYQERLVLSDGERLMGRCAELVTLRGRVILSDPKPPVTIQGGSAGSALRGVTLTGPGEGLVIDGAQQVTVEEVEVADTAGYGIAVNPDSEATLHRVKVVRGTVVGIMARGAVLTLSESVVRDTQPDGGLLFGRGIDAACASGGTCGGLTISRSLVARNRDTSLYLTGLDVDVVDSAIRDTQPKAVDGTAGVGITAVCHSDGTCGTLDVSGSSLSGHRNRAVFSYSAVTTITDTTVRDTLPQESDAGWGQGINAFCDTEQAGCGSLTVTSSLVAHNRSAGIFLYGVDAVVVDTIVRGTLAGADERHGEGIYTRCVESDTCGSLSVSGCLISDNRSAGVLAEGVDTTLTDTVIRDTNPTQADLTGGRGIDAQCDPDFAICGRLTVTSSVVARNRDIGLFIAGVESVVTSTVVRDTLSLQSDGTAGVGIAVRCTQQPNVCARLSVTSSWISNNRETGILATGVETTIASTVVRDTRADSLAGSNGLGIAAECEEQPTHCAPLRVTESLVSGNRVVGIYGRGVETTVTDTVVRDTRSREDTLSGGAGVAVECHSADTCGSLAVSGSLVSGNRGLGIFAAGANATVSDTVVRDSLPWESDGRFGRGINIRCDVTHPTCGTAHVSSTLVHSGLDAGIYISGVNTILEGVAVADTIPTLSGDQRGEFGQAILALCSDTHSICPTLQATHCLVDSSYSAGLAARGVSGFLNGSVVRNVVAQPLDSKYGYGVQLEGLEGQTGTSMPSFNVLSCEIRDANLSGVLYFRARGTLSGSVVTGAENSVIMNEGSEPTILGDNELSGTVENEPTWANLFPSPAPPPALPQ
ncbi:MAG: right-handed parallel beta-helix repeat-containing protein [bacterium]